MSYPLPDKLLQMPENIIKQLMKKVVANQNGDVSKAMTRMGYEYPINYGVVIPQLRSLAGGFEPDHMVAQQLREFAHIREALILSTMLDEPHKINPNEAIEICGLIDNIELAEQFSRNIFAHIPDLLFFLNKIIGINEIHTTIAFLSFGWAIKLKKPFSEDEVDWLLNSMNNLTYLENSRISGSIAFAMQAIAECTCAFESKVHILAVSFSKSENKAVARLGDEFLWMNTD